MTTAGVPNDTRVFPSAFALRAGWLWREALDFPATTLLCLSWILVFALMVSDEISSNGPMPWGRFLVTGIGPGERYGDLSLADLKHYQIWRLITCNFVHYSVLHLGLNLAAMYQLGTLIESWYGGWRLLAIQTLLGVAGNGLGILIRHLIASNPQVHSGGGSVVVMGLVGLCTVVGYRSRRQLGLLLFHQMIFLLGVTALLGFVFPAAIDNWGHLGGTVVGMALGLRHETWLKRYRAPSTFGAGLLAVMAILASAAAQTVSTIHNRPLYEQQRLARKLQGYSRFEQALTMGQSFIRRGEDASGLVVVLDQTFDLVEPTSRKDVAELRGLLAATAQRKLTGAELDRYAKLADPLVKWGRRRAFRLRNELYREERNLGLRR